MKWTKFFKKIKPTIGIDLSSDCIRVVELQEKGRNLKVVQFHRFPIPSGFLIDGQILDKRQLVKAMDVLVENLGWQGRQVATCVHGRKVMIRYLKFPSMSQEELKQAVHYEAEKYLPMVKQEMVLDYVNLEPLDNSGEKQLQVLLAAVPKEIVMDYYEVFCAVNLDLVAVDIIPLALQRVFLPLMNRGEVYAVAHLGTEGTNLVVFANNQANFARSFALVAKNEQGLLSGHLYQEVAAAVDRQQGKEEHWQELVRELRRSLDYWRNQNQGRTLSHLYLTGLGAQMSGIEHFISQELGLAVSVFHPLQGLTDNNVLLAPEYAVACGLAMRGVSG